MINIAPGFYSISPTIFAGLRIREAWLQVVFGFGIEFSISKGNIG
jgi:hypothetical protein